MHSGEHAYQYLRISTTYVPVLWSSLLNSTSSTTSSALAQIQFISNLTAISLLTQDLPAAVSDAEKVRGPCRREISRSFGNPGPGLCVPTVNSRRDDINIHAGVYLLDGALRITFCSRSPNSHPEMKKDGKTGKVGNFILCCSVQQEPWLCIKTWGVASIPVRCCPTIYVDG